MKQGLRSSVALTDPDGYRLIMSRAASSKPRAKPARAGSRSGKAKNDASRRSPVRRTIKWVAVGLIVLALVPIVLVPVFRFVRPIGTYMAYTHLTDGPVERRWVAFDDIAKVLVVSVMVSEDARYCEHRGIDWGELRSVIEDPDGPSRGASTIAMQTVRNLFLWTSRSYVRKALEIPLALYGDAVWGKRREMEIYLNIAQWGPHLFGIEAAARHYFDRPAARLTARQAALLAVALPNPIARDPAHPSSWMNSRARTIEARARSAGPYIVCLYP